MEEIQQHKGEDWKGGDSDRMELEHMVFIQEGGEMLVGWGWGKAVLLLAGSYCYFSSLCMNCRPGGGHGLILVEGNCKHASSHSHSIQCCHKPA